MLNEPPIGYVIVNSFPQQLKIKVDIKNVFFTTNFHIVNIKKQFCVKPDQLIILMPCISSSSLVVHSYVLRPALVSSLIPFLSHNPKGSQMSAMLDLR